MHTLEIVHYRLISGQFILSSEATWLQQWNIHMC